MERHTEIEHVLRPALFGDYRQHSGNSFRTFWDKQLVPSSRVKLSKRNLFDSRQPAHNGCLLVKLTVTELI